MKILWARMSSKKDTLESKTILIGGKMLLLKSKLKTKTILTLFNHTNPIKFAFIKFRYGKIIHRIPIELKFHRSKSGLSLRINCDLTIVTGLVRVSGKSSSAGASKGKRQLLFIAICNACHSQLI